MAKKKKGEKPGTEILQRKGGTDLVPATIIEGKAGTDYGVDLPEFLKKEGTFKKVAPTGFTPLISFGEDPEKWQPGSWIIAKYLATRHGIGPNSSEMYDFEITPDGKTFKVATLWGSTILDTKFRLLDAKAGDWIFIQYLGTTETSRKQNPAKDYFLAIMEEKVVAGLGYQGKA
jgi:hypothetical protein